MAATVMPCAAGQWLVFRAMASPPHTAGPVPSQRQSLRLPVCTTVQLPSAVVCRLKRSGSLRASASLRIHCRSAASWWALPSRRLRSSSAPKPGTASVSISATSAATTQASTRLYPCRAAARGGRKFVIAGSLANNANHYKNRSRWRLPSMGGATRRARGMRGAAQTSPALQMSRISWRNSSTSSKLR